MAVYLPTIGEIDKIEYIVRKKFPLYNRKVANVRENSPIAFQQKNGKEYAEELSKKSPDEITLLYLQQVKVDKEEKEAAMFFNKPQCNADFDHWSKAHHWTLDEALALSFGKEPTYVTWKSLQGYDELNSDFVKEYAKRRDLALRAVTWSKLFDPVLPSIFVNWIKANEFDFPPELEALVAKRQGLWTDWKTIYERTKALADSAMQEVAACRVALKEKDAMIADLNVQIEVLVNHVENSMKTDKAADGEKFDAWLKDLVAANAGKPPHAKEKVLEEYKKRDDIGSAQHWTIKSAAFLDVWSKVAPANWKQSGRKSAKQSA